jgi:hypothetical protein
MKGLNGRSNQLGLLLDTGDWCYLIYLHVLAAPANSTAGCAWNEFTFALMGVNPGWILCKGRDTNSEGA